MGGAVGQPGHATQDGLGDAQPLRRHQGRVEADAVVADGDLEAVGGGEHRDGAVHRPGGIVPRGRVDRVAQGLTDGAENGRHGRGGHGAFDARLLAGAGRVVEAHRGIRGDLVRQRGDAAGGVGDQDHRLRRRGAQRVELGEGLGRVAGDHIRRGAAEAGHQQGGDDAVVHQRVDAQPLLPAGHPRGPVRLGLPGEQGGLVDPGRGAAGGEGERHEHAHQKQRVEAVGQADEGRVGIGGGPEPHETTEQAGKHRERPGQAPAGEDGDGHAGHPGEGDHPGDVGAGGQRTAAHDEPKAEDHDEAQRLGRNEAPQDARRPPPDTEAQGDRQAERRHPGGRGQPGGLLPGLRQVRRQRQQAEDAGRGRHGDAQQPGEVGGGGVGRGLGDRGNRHGRVGGLLRAGAGGGAGAAGAGAAGQRGHERPGSGRMPSSSARLYRSILVFAGRPTRSYLDRTRRM